MARPSILPEVRLIDAFPGADPRVVGLIISFADFCALLGDDVTLPTIHALADAHRRLYEGLEDLGVAMVRPPQPGPPTNAPVRIQRALPWITVYLQVPTEVMLQNRKEYLRTRLQAMFRKMKSEAPFNMLLGPPDFTALTYIWVKVFRGRPGQLDVLRLVFSASQMRLTLGFARASREMLVSAMWRAVQVPGARPNDEIIEPRSDPQLVSLYYPMWEAEGFVDRILQEGVVFGPPLDPNHAVHYAQQFTGFRSDMDL